MTNLPTDPKTVRLDKWLWCVRIFKTRQLATVGCRLKRVLTPDGDEVKPSRLVQVGDLLQIHLDDYVKSIRVTALLHQRVAGKQVEHYYADLTTPEVYAALKERRLAISMAPAVAPAFRPNKHDRELIKKLFEPREEMDSSED